MTGIHIDCPAMYQDGPCGQSGLSTIEAAVKHLKDAHPQSYGNIPAWIKVAAERVA